MQPFQNTNIQVASIEAKMASTGNMKYILTATDKKKYYFFQKVKGADSDVFQVFNNMGVKQGSIINIGFTEEEKSFVGKDGKNINYTDRYIGSMREADAVAAQTPTAPQKTPVKSNLSEPAYVSEQKDEKFWEKKAFKQCLWGYWLERYPDVKFQAKTADGTLGQAEMDLVWQVFNQIEKDADKRFATGWDKAVKTFAAEDAPLPEDPGEINVESIPF